MTTYHILECDVLPPTRVWFVVLVTRGASSSRIIVLGSGKCSLFHVGDRFVLPPSPPPPPSPRGKIMQYFFQTISFRPRWRAVLVSSPFRIKFPADKKITSSIPSVHSRARAFPPSTLGSWRQIVKTIEHRMGRYTQVVLDTCAYAGTGNVLKVQEMLHLCAEHLDEKAEHQVPQDTN